MTTCPHCNKSVTRLNNIQVGIAGSLLNVRVCKPCKVNLDKIREFAGAFPSSGGASAPAPSRKPRIKKESVDHKFDSHALSKEEIARTQRLRPSVRMVDSPASRKRDDVTSLRARTFVMAQPGMGGYRNKKVMAELTKQLGTDRINIIKDDGFEVVAERAN